MYLLGVSIEPDDALVCGQLGDRRRCGQGSERACQDTARFSHRGYDPVGECVLSLEHVTVAQVAVEVFRPEVGPGGRVDQLDAYADGGACFPDAAFDEKARAKLRPDRAYVSRSQILGRRRRRHDQEM
jgi:hypothetical protein